MFTGFTGSRNACLLSFSFPPPSSPLPLHLILCAWVYVSARSFFILHYSRIKDTVILWECGVHYRSSLPSRVNVFNKRDCLFSQYTLKRYKIANVSSVVAVCSNAHCSNHLDHLGRWARNNETSLLNNSCIWKEGSACVRVVAFVLNKNQVRLKANIFFLYSLTNADVHLSLCGCSFLLF